MCLSLRGLLLLGASGGVRSDVDGDHPQAGTTGGGCTRGDAHVPVFSGVKKETEHLCFVLCCSTSWSSWVPGQGNGFLTPIGFGNHPHVS